MMNTSLIGILGGMGPLASAGFVNLLYQKCRAKFTAEQYYPRVILISDPAIPDRIAGISNDNFKNIVISLETNIKKLLSFGADHNLICCFTAHYFLSSLSLESQKSIIHLGKLLTAYLDATQKNTLVLSSEFLAQSGLIDSVYAIYPEKMYFNQLHQIIYKIKLNGPDLYHAELIEFTQSLAKLYDLSQVLFACTEFHLVYQNMHANFIKDQKIYILDGLNIAADFILKKYL